MPANAYKHIVALTDIIQTDWTIVRELNAQDTLEYRAPH